MVGGNGFVGGDIGDSDGAVGDLGGIGFVGGLYGGEFGG